MQIRCQRCHKPFALSKETVHAALAQMAAENLSHFDANCPHCRRNNRVSQAELKRAAPDWGKPPAAETPDTPAEAVVSGHQEP
jgi:phage FluMu protein Com